MARSMAAGVLAGSFAWAYWDVLRWLVKDWNPGGEYSHGFLVVPIAIFLVWERRHLLREAPVRPAAPALLIVAASIGLLIVGTLASQVLARLSLVGFVAGAVGYLFGWRHLRILSFPIAFLLLMIPLPEILFNRLVVSLQLIASAFAEQSLVAVGIPVHRAGNVLSLPRTTLDIAEACSGIRSLMSLVTFGTLYAYYTSKTRWGAWMLVALTVPIAIVANGLRVAGTGVAAYYYGAGAAASFFHTFSGLLVFMVALAGLPLAGWCLTRLHRLVSVRPQARVAEA